MQIDHLAEVVQIAEVESSDQTVVRMYLRLVVSRLGHVQLEVGPFLPV
jgi:hypothetical protein